jgi:hypothetical protein
MVPKDSFDVGCKVRIENRRLAGLFFVCLSQGDAFGDGSPERLGGAKYCDGSILVLDYHSDTVTNASQYTREVAGGFRVRNADLPPRAPRRRS